MDILKQISVLLWIVAAILIAPPVLRYFGLTPREAVSKLLVLGSNAHIASVSSTPMTTPLRNAPQDDEALKELFDTPAAGVAAQPETTPSASTSPEDEKKFNEMISGLERIGKIVSSPSDKIQQLPSTFMVPQNAQDKVRWLPPPPGFMTAETFNYLIYRQQYPVSPSLSTVLDNIHGNLMLNLTPFTIVVKPNKILVMLFGDKTSYMDYTRRPPWSGAASDLKADTMYILEGDGFYPLSIHELTHLYFDGYFLPATSPLWLSEGMAVYMQITQSNIKPKWITDSMATILSGRYMPLDELTSIEDLSSTDTQTAELWYTQSYSLVSYLLKERSRAEFYTFCNELKQGVPLYQALYRAYGMPFNKVSVLENVWFHDLRKRNNLPPLVQTAPATTAVDKAKTTRDAYYRGY